MKTSENERLMLSLPRLLEVPEEEGAEAPFTPYFTDLARLLIAVVDDCNTELTETAACAWQYPIYAVQMLGEEYGLLLSSICFEIVQGIRAVSTDCPHAEMRYTILVELFLELYGEFSCGTPGVRTVRRIFADYLIDYLPDYEYWYLEAKLAGKAADFPVPVVLTTPGTVQDPEHAEDLAVILDEEFVSRRKRVLRETLTEMQTQPAFAEGLRQIRIGQRNRKIRRTEYTGTGRIRMTEVQFLLFEEMEVSLKEISDRYIGDNMPE